MALSLGQAGLTENDPDALLPENEYLTCATEQDFAIRMHLDAVDGIAHDVTEGVKSLPRRGAEIGGLLLGRVTRAELTDVCVERYQRMECEHRYGPQFALDASEIENVAAAASSLSGDDELTVLGFYRSNTRPDFQIETSDREILDLYFPDPGDLALLIRPVDSRETRAQFFVRSDAREWLPAGEDFLFRGRVVGAFDEPEPQVPPEPVAANSPVQPEKPRRLVPDFMPPREEPAVAPEEPASAPARQQDDTQPRSLRWWPLAGALALVGGALFFLFQSQRADKPDTTVQPAAVEASGAVRPLGLYADPNGDTWRISWNTSANALQSARGVALFVREGEDQNRIDLAPRDLQSGTYQYQPRPDNGAAKDITFRLEVTDAAGHVSAESFRVIRSVASAPAAAAPHSKPAVAHPKALKKIPPVVPASIRPRIRGSVPVDVRVEIDDRGRVASAVPTAKARNGLNAFLASRAVAAAKQWRFEPGPATEIIHFVFER